MKSATKASVAVLVLFSIACSATSGASANAQATTPRTPTRVEGQVLDPKLRGAATKAFLARIGQYVSFHNNVAKMVPAFSQTPDPALLSKRQAALAEAIIKQRPDAKEGDFLIKQYQPYLRQIISEDFTRRPAADRKALIVELPKDVAIGVNMVYPTTLPLATFPGNLLKLLPELPPDLEYRIVGRHLVLRDVEANVIVDLMRDVFPV
ncbi:MAG: hypothetical protein H0T71_00450 [Acidobacteria bacterium]|nr:hypothetical protein [Acidobacteriota bacterium]